MDIVKELDGFFNPSAVAIIGASREKGAVGRVILENFLTNKEKGIFKGEVYPVNPKADEIAGVKCYPSIKEIPGKVDLGVVCVPARIVPKIIEDCGEKGVKCVIVISAGFSEIGNHALEEQLVKTAKKHGVRIIGPNCIGIYDPWSGVDTLFIPMYKDSPKGPLLSMPRPKKGHIAFISQSGAFGAAVLDYFAGTDLGLSKFISYGNKCDVDEADLLEYLAEDETTRAIMIYIENIKEGRKFMEISKKVALKKPIVVLKSGRTAAGAKAAASHTGALAGVDAIYDAAFKQCGVIRARDMEEFCDMAKALAMQPPAKGNRIAVVTDGGGCGVMASDEIEFQGMKLAEFSKETLEKFEELKKQGILRDFAVTIDPVDLTGSADDRGFVESMKLVLSDLNVDGVILLPMHQVPLVTTDLPKKLSEIIKKYGKPVVVCDIGEADMAKYYRRLFDEEDIPTYPTPERAVRAIKALVEYGKILEKLKTSKLKYNSVVNRLRK